MSTVPRRTQIISPERGGQHLSSNSHVIWERWHAIRRVRLGKTSVFMAARSQLPMADRSFVKERVIVRDFRSSDCWRICGGLDGNEGRAEFQFIDSFLLLCFAQNYAANAASLGRKYPGCGSCSMRFGRAFRTSSSLMRKLFLNTPD